MELEQFIQDIIQQGKVIVAGQVLPFTPEDAQQAIQRLREYYVFPGTCRDQLGILESNGKITLHNIKE